jgi:DedD protein
MNQLMHRESHFDEDDEAGRDREYSLGMTTILGIFFALVLVCAGFFGFGYTLGRKSAQTASTGAESAGGGNFSSFKPAAGRAGAPAAIADPNARVADVTPPAPVRPEPVERPLAKGVAPSDTVIAGAAVPAARPVTRVVPEAAAVTPVPVTAVAGNFMVQVAAVSSQEIADIELTALRKKGYNVVVRQEPQDKLLHVQIGPFASRKDAEAMRDRVGADGFHAIIK